jgi:SET domain-containing protein
VQTVYTLRDVRAGEELLWDYGASYDRSRYSTRGKAEESVAS